MKHLAYILPLLLAAILLPAHAATPEQMEQARVIAVKACLRDLNNGSDYLESLKPASMSDLEKSLKAKEKENITKLKAIQLPDQSEYAGWDKAQFEKYWTKTFTSKANLKTRDFTASKIKESIKGVQVTKQDPKPAEDKKEEPKAEEATTPQPEEQPADQPTPAEEIPEETFPEPVTEQVTVTDTPTEKVTPVPETPKPKSDDHTTAIILLCALVAVVIILVGYALNVMKKNRIRTSNTPSRRSRRYEDEEDDDDDDEPLPSPRRAPRRSPQSATPTVVADLEDESPFAAYSAFQPEPTPSDDRDREIARLKAEIASLQGQVRTTESARPMHDIPAHRPRVIYLAQANASGVFTRADARYNEGNSIFKLVTTDGVSGSFSLIEDPAVFDIALMMPKDFLFYACAGTDLLSPLGASTIINEASGTAIFEDGRWHVSRKARIRYVR